MMVGKQWPHQGVGGGAEKPNYCLWSIWVPMLGLGKAGVNFLKNLRYLSVALPDPSSLTKYRLNWRTSMTKLVLSHLDG